MSCLTPVRCTTKTLGVFDQSTDLHRSPRGELSSSLFAPKKERTLQSDRRSAGRQRDFDDHPHQLLMGSMREMQRRNLAGSRMFSARSVIVLLVVANFAGSCQRSLKPFTLSPRIRLAVSFMPPQPHPAIRATESCRLPCAVPPPTQWLDRHNPAWTTLDDLPFALGFMHPKQPQAPDSTT